MALVKYFCVPYDSNRFISNCWGNCASNCPTVWPLSGPSATRLGWSSRSVSALGRPAFGRPAHRTSAGPDSSESPTIVGATTVGVILGTAAYMSPEQARGKPIDKRTDIWAFGCVLFEMLTGSSAFGRETVTDPLAAVVRAEPEWKSLPVDMPDSIRRLLARCLQKDERRRLHDIADARIELEETMAAPPEPATVPTPRRWSRAVFAALLLGIVSLLVFLWAVRHRSEKTAAEPSAADTRITRLTDIPGLAESPAISPDGKSVAFTAGVGGKRQVFVQLIAGGAPLQITRDAVDHESPRWSPNSSSILYFSPATPGTVQGSIWEIPALGGAPRRVVNSVGGADVSRTDGRLALFRLAKEGLQLVTASPDGSRFDVVADFVPATYYLFPRWSPDGDGLLFNAETASGSTSSSRPPREGDHAS
jgi:eukaryotic-like serine/threonine-protein kinase